jgi:citrate synthase
MDKLKSKFFEKSLNLNAEIKSILKEHGSDKVDEVSLKQIFGGMRGVKSMLWETSLLDADEGIRFRGYSIPELKKILPSAPGCSEPLPEGLFWLMLVGEIPTQQEVNWLSDEWELRGKVPQHTYDIIDALPINAHPMTQFCVAISSMQTESVFAKRYAAGLSKEDYWGPTYEDTMNLIAKLPHVAAYIHRRMYHDSVHLKADLSLDWAGNFAHMLGVENKDFKSLMRLYMTVHADHEGGNASAHTAHLVNSTLSDPYLAFTASMTSLAGPLHGLANQEVIKFIFDMIDELGSQKLKDKEIKTYIHKTLNDGKVIPGYGHAVLRKPDPRFIAFKDFAENYIQDSNIVKIVWQLFDLVPPILQGLGKVRNPWPNIDAHSGSLLVHYGLDQYRFYTVLFGVSRALGVLASMCWSRALGMPLERPKSVTMDWVRSVVKETAVKT